MAKMLRTFATSARYFKLKEAAKSQIQALPEAQQRQRLEGVIQDRAREHGSQGGIATVQPPAGFTKDQALRLVQASVATFLLHVESRIAALVGEGFYTIGPCGEEVMSVLGCLARPTDPLALHYRHLGASIARRIGNGWSVEDTVLDRARGYTCSMNDSITGGRHCALGGTEYDFYVTSTLASQAPAAVGRALGIGLASYLNAQDRRGVAPAFPRDSVSICSVGDGSVNNAMYLSALNFADYAQHRGFKCPAVFVVSNNDICISLRGYSWLETFLKKQVMPVITTDGRNVFDVWTGSARALSTARSTGRPIMLVVDKLPRRFGHAATDRQQAYLEQEDIQTAAQTDTVGELCEQLVETNLISWEEIHAQWHSLATMVEESFATASEEPKITEREQAVARLHSALIPVELEGAQPVNSKQQATMRMCMTHFFSEVLTRYKECVYLGEDVRHGGYYLVSDQLHNDFPHRVHDIPPDETMLLGIALGYSQSGLTPIVELPYAKYLDCGADQFFEIGLLHWCTNGNEQNGMLIRLQGFDKGKFGGNFHTHNSLHMPPGIDVVCYSNGVDYVRGLRYVMEQVKVGRVVMSVDSTDLLHRRDLFPEKRDGLWPSTYPDLTVPLLTFEHVVLYCDKENPLSAQDISGNEDAAVPEISDADCIVLTYGNGVPSALQCMVQSESHRVVVVDCPNLGRLPKGLERLLSGGNASVPIVFADVCKEGPNPLSYLVVLLKNAGLLERRWKHIAASPTYNPLGSLCTFLSLSDITTAVTQLTEAS